MHVFVHSIIRLNYHEFSYLLIFNIIGKQYIQHAIIFWSHKEVRIYLSIEDLTERCGIYMSLMAADVCHSSFSLSVLH